MSEIINTSILRDKNGLGVSMIDQTARDAAAVNAEEIVKLTEDNAQRFMIKEMPVFLDRAKFSIAAPYTSLEILDARTFGLCVEYATSNLYRLNLASLEQEKLCTAELAGGATNPTPWWFCGKLLPRWGTDYELALLWDRNNNRVCLIKTSDGAVLTAPTGQKLGWLRNTGIDCKYNSIGAFNQTAIYAEYWLPEFDTDSSIDKVRVWRTTNGGYNWTEVFSQNTRVSDSSEVFHFHLVRNDPYNPDHWYLTSGDAASECHVWRSIDDGLTWTQIDDPNYSGDRQIVHRTCEMYFTEDYIYWGMDDIDSDFGAAWVRTPRNLDTNQLSIEILADLKDRARQTVQTPYGVIIATEAQHSGTVNSFIWLAPYEDLTKPVLVATLPMAPFGNQISHYAYGGRFFSSEAWTDRTHKLYAPATADSRCNVIDLCMLSRPYW